MGKKFKNVASSTATPVAGQAAIVSKKGLISDTTCTGLPSTTWQGTYNLLEAEQPEKTVTEASVDELKKSEATLKDLADSFLHRIAAREQVLPFRNRTPNGSGFKSARRAVRSADGPRAASAGHACPPAVPIATPSPRSREAPRSISA